MSLFRQVWFMIIASALLAFMAALLISTYSARDYLQTQLYTQSSDTASALALSISQQANDPAMVELMTNALFDSGHFEWIRISDPHGKTVYEQFNRELPSKVPDWFIQRFPIVVLPGEALISNGWKQAGKVQIRAHSRFAYESLWLAGKKLLFWMLLGGMFTGALMTLLLKHIRRPIIQMMQQVSAMSERKFIHISPPPYIELRPMADAMNSMVARVKSMFDEQAGHIEQLKLDANRDAVTGLANRSFFMARLASLLSDEESLPDGVLLMLRLNNLADINRHLGHQATDRLLMELATRLAQHADSNPDWQAARLNGSDFVLVAPGMDDEKQFAEQLLADIASLAPEVVNLLHIGYGEYERGDTVSKLLSRIDAALARAEAHPHNAVSAAQLIHHKLNRPNTYWRDLLQTAIEHDQFDTVSYEVLDFAGQLLHKEMMLRLPDPQTGALHSAGMFIPFARRFDLLPKLDLAAIRLALQQLGRESNELAVNISPASISHPPFRRELATLLAQQTKATLKRLWLEINEHALIEDSESLATFATEMHQLGIKVGIEHFGRQIGSMSKLYDLPLDYLKIDNSYIHEIDQHSGNQQLVKAMVGIARNLDLMIIAELVRSNAEWQTLEQLGLTGATGPVTETQQGI
ncbi:EAL domain-containing protein [Chitinibacter sp. S2-10]|uniref:bifunctional diguanylate cyclase/phosphodiesterase n=1 Tax=Chitinibacter sp. S2-10 TaxID=3373597 RepID=UPI0039775A53